MASCAEKSHPGLQSIACRSPRLVHASCTMDAMASRQFDDFQPSALGTIIAIIIPMPVILLDGRLASPATTLMKATMGQLASWLKENAPTPTNIY